MIAQLACQVEVLRAIPRTVFHPQPNVDSVLISMRRLEAGPGAGAGGPALSSALRALVAGSFAHRRKTLAGSLELSGRVPERSRAQVRAALQELGHPADARAERLSPQDFAALAALLEL